MDEADLYWLEGFLAHSPSTEEQKALVYARKTGRVDNAAFRSLNRTDTLSASRALTHLESLGLVRRSEQRRGPGVYYTLVGKNGTSQVTPQVTYQGTYQGTKELLGLLAGGQRLSQQQMDNLIVALCTERPQRARELAHTLRRSAGHVSDAYLSRLVREGRLQLTGSTNDPNVAYRAA